MIADSKELLHRFFDNDLSELQEEALFNQLAGDEGLRNEMKMVIALRAAIEANDAYFVPSTELTAGVFGALGFSSPSSAPLAAASSAGMVLWLSLLKKSGVVIAAAVLSSFLTMFFMQSHPSALQEVKQPETITQQYQYAEEKTAQYNQHTLKEMSNLNVQERKSLPSSSRYPLLHSVYAANVQEPARKQEADIPEERQMPEAPTLVLRSEEVTPIHSVSLQPDMMVGQSASALATVPQTISQQYSPFIQPDSVEKLPLHFSLRTITTLGFYPKRQSQIADETTTINNVALAIGYALSERSYIGLEAGRETYPLLVKNDNGVFQKSNSLLWGGAFLQYCYTLPYNSINTFSIEPGIIVGGTELGPLLKTQFGINWKPDTRILFRAGLEGTLVSFHHDRTWEVAPKVALSYGIRFTF